MQNSHTKIEPVKIGTVEAIEFFKEENELIRNTNKNANITIEYRVRMLAINALEEKLSREATSDRICMAAGLMQTEMIEKDDGTYAE